MQIAKIHNVPLREIWKREDKDFSAWLEENIDYLNEALDFDITVEQRRNPLAPLASTCMVKTPMAERSSSKINLKTDRDTSGRS